MATKVTTEMISQMNEAYVDLKTYAAVARQFGISPTTVKKYIVPGYIKRADVVFTPVGADVIKGVEDFILTREGLTNPDALKLSALEQEEIKSLWKEISI